MQVADSKPAVTVTVELTQRDFNSLSYLFTKLSNSNRGAGLDLSALFSIVTQLKPFFKEETELEKALAEVAALRTQLLKMHAERDRLIAERDDAEQEAASVLDPTVEKAFESLRKRMPIVFAHMQSY
jgi:biopolymer transport protein ExbB/TolQ